MFTQSSIEDGGVTTLATADGSAYLVVSLEDDWVDGFGWTAGETVQLEVKAADGTAVHTSDNTVSDWGGFRVDLWPSVDVVEGGTVTAVGSVTRTLALPPLAIDVVDSTTVGAPRTRALRSTSPSTARGGPSPRMTPARGTSP